MGIFLDIFVTVMGAAIGSFLNVCILRLPEEGQSIVRPSSRCPRCGHAIRWYDNVPILSYLILRGACRDCGGKISLQYPLVEALTALLSFLLFRKYGLSWAWLFSFLFVCSLVVIAFIDLRHQIIPHAITLPGIPFFLAAAALFMGYRFVDVFLGAAIGAATLYFVAVYYEAVTGREGMGGGDVNLLAMIGAFLGWKSLLFVVLASSLLGAVVGIAVMVAKGKDMKYAIPFGPFLCIGAAAYLFCGERLMERILFR
ncbi:MAG: Type 4 prepilin-like proteins leader peptide-processing enzyme [Syntrophaceae bacterium PtaU1.Bin231]|nr:MAG: Type 4 prepilin-like proteins leader peptide-processing enzyme [Syntrophaceae bacterium PtaU1.Bin231]HOG16168.1 prepilin peptidase [Syntrophales bacterium]